MIKSGFYRDHMGGPKTLAIFRQVSLGGVHDSELSPLAQGAHEMPVMAALVIQRFLCHLFMVEGSINMHNIDVYIEIDR